MNTHRLICLSLLGFLLASCGKAPPAPPQMSPPEVTVAQPLRKNLTEWDEYTGRFEAAERVEIRARVSGYLDEIRFKDGEKVAKGQVLYVIDQRPFTIALERATAQHELAEKELKRLQGLYPNYLKILDFSGRIKGFRQGKLEKAWSFHVETI